MRLPKKLTVCLAAIGLALGVSGSATAGPGAGGPTFLADISGDGITDIIILETTSSLLYGFILDNTGNIASHGPIFALPAGNTVSAFVDIDGDKKADCIVMDATGGVSAVLLNGVAIVSSAAILGVPAGFTIAAWADVTGDKKWDLVLQQTATGLQYLIALNGTTMVPASSGPIVAVPGGFTVAQYADINGDMKADLVLLSTAGLLYAFLLDGTTILNGPGAPLFTVGAAFQVASWGDLDGDMKVDVVVLQTATGLLFGFRLDGTNASPASGPIITLPAGTTLVGTGNYDGVQMAKSTSDLMLLDVSGVLLEVFLDTFTITGQNAAVGLPAGWTTVKDGGVKI